MASPRMSKGKGWYIPNFKAIKFATRNNFFSTLMTTSFRANFEKLYAMMSKFCVRIFQKLEVFINGGQTWRMPFKFNKFNFDYVICIGKFCTFVRKKIEFCSLSLKKLWPSEETKFVPHFYRNFMVIPSYSENWAQFSTPLYKFTVLFLHKLCRQ